MEADELVEAMAKAIWNSRDPGRMLYFRWNDEHTLEEWKDTYRVAAQAALSALEAERFSQTLTTDSEVIFGGVRIDPGTYQIRRVDAPVGERRTQPDDPVPPTRNYPPELTQERLVAVALAIYEQVHKNAGVPRKDARASWKVIGPEGRGYWKLVAKQAIAALDDSDER